MVYNFNSIEKKWQKKWEQAKIFEVKKSAKKKFYVLDMFPYPSGAGLHIGHAFVFSLGDIFARFKRLQGFNVLYPIGYDSLGLPAENAAIKVGTHPEEYTKKSIANFMKQQKAMGWSYDWSRMVKTSDEKYYKWDQWIFLKMFEKGIAYRKKAPVNWCPKCNTVLANEQVTGGKCWRHEDTNVEIKHLEQWFFRITKYAEDLLEGLNKIDWPERAKIMQKNWIGKSYGTEIDFEIETPAHEGCTLEPKKTKFPIFTTRPDTIFGVTFMVISAQHSKLMELVTADQEKEVKDFLKRLKSVSEKELENMEKEGVFTGSYAINPMTKERVPVYAGNFVVADYGSGMVMAVPAHDQRDFDFAKKYGIKIKKVIVPEKSRYCVIEKSLPKDKINELKKFGNIEVELVDKDWGEFIIVYPDSEKEEKLKEFLKKNLLKKSNEAVGWYTNSNEVAIFNNKIISISESLDEFKKYGKSLGIPEKQLDLDMKEAYTGDGRLINSGDFTQLLNREAINHITQYLEDKKLGRKKIQYKLRDWLISRQRYWGTPIPIIYCDDCGMIPVPEKDLPVKLPKNVKFGKGNPLATNEKFVNVKCPKCGGKARRETDTMDTFVNSSWYYLRYTDPKNDKKIFGVDKANYWAPIDQYIGGPEHITMHLIYMRFYTKFLKDLGLLKFDEPALRYFTQGIVKGSDGNRMSKSKGNVIEPLEMIEKYGADSLRFYLVSNSSPDSDFAWDNKGMHGAFKFVDKVYNYFENFKPGKSNARIESKLNKTIKEVTELIEYFKHNLIIIKLRDLFNSFNEEIDKKTAESFLKMLHIYCPFITEELWEKLGNKEFISLAKWPVADEKKIDEKLEEQEKMIEKISDDINHVKELVKKKINKCFVYVLPNEKEVYLEDLNLIKKKTGLEITVYAVNDKDKYDPENKSKKVKPGRPGIYLE